MPLQNIQLYLASSEKFLGIEVPYEDSKYVAFGVPYDLTSSYRPGSRHGPRSVRQASANIEVYSQRTSCDASKLAASDIGDVIVTYDLRSVLRRTRQVVKTVVSDGKVPIMIGGEHTFTLSAVSQFSREIRLVSFDAHLDSRREYFGERIGHATFMRHLINNFRNVTPLFVGVRAYDPSEEEFLKKKNVRLFTSNEVHNSVEGVMESLREFSKNSVNYVTIDLDILDPRYAPGVGNPEPEGIDSSQLIDMISVACNDKTVGLDLMETCPTQDSGQSSVIAAKILTEALCSIEKASKRRS